MKRAVLWCMAVVLAAGLTVLAGFPAAWLGPMIERQTGGRLTLGDAQGTLWRGSAFLGGAPGAGGAVTPLLPGRFSWQLSPLVLFGLQEALSSSATGYVIRADEVQSPARVTSARGRHA